MWMYLWAHSTSWLILSSADGWRIIRIQIVARPVALFWFQNQCAIPCIAIFGRLLIVPRKKNWLIIINYKVYLWAITKWR